MREISEREREEEMRARGKSVIVPFFCALAFLLQGTLSRVLALHNSIRQLSDKFSRGFFRHLK